MIKELFVKIKSVLKIILESIAEGKAQRAKFYMSSHSTKR
jgi:hypothetical protein